MFLSIAFAFLAGVLSSLSPCVLPLLPIVFGAAISQHRFGPLALATGMALSFVIIGLFVATIGFSLGLTAGLFRTFAAVLLIVIGTILVVTQLQTQLAGMAGPISNWTQNRFGGFDSSGLGGQVALGLLLGAVWRIPCVGPTLGAASVLASQGKDLVEVALTMGVFGLGAAVPLVVLGLLSRESMLGLRGTLMEAGSNGKLALGIVLIVAGLLITTGLDKILEAKLVVISPAWLTQLTTSI